ncbi:hypothetical protein RHMOL_Rhmol02G0143800 [Rhododendron molle]|uniref:Uncharacterized protein n=1 Tax=Rhododendron molle TaxID=49168 RepID=A0ACC0PRG0_RHOML|nr:hypothetical protein RHMOL_Rhmol02G0143800 [Rhododendron molle]
MDFPAPPLESPDASPRPPMLPEEFTHGSSAIGSDTLQPSLGGHAMALNSGKDIVRLIPDPRGGPLPYVAQDMASNGPEEHLRSSDPEKSVSNLRPDTLALEGGCGKVEFSSASEARQKGESRIDVDDPQYEKYGFGECSGDKEEFVPLVERGAPKDDEARNDVNFSLRDSGIMTSEMSKALSISGKEMDAAIAIREESCNEPYAVSLETETKKMVPLSTEDINQEPTRFLHIKDNGNITSPKPEGDVAALAEKSELQAGGGVGDGTERSQSTDFPNARASSVAYSSSFSLERTLSGDHGKNPRWHRFGENHKILSLQRDNLSHSNSPETSQSPINKDTARPLSSSKDVGRENLKQNWPSEDIPMHRNSFFPDPRSLARNSSIPSDAYASLPTTGIVSSQSISGLTRSSFSFSSLDKNPLGASKLPDFVQEYRASGSASLLRSSSPFSGSESGNLSLTDVSGDPLRIAGHRTRITTNDWEPSVPFRPSYFITQRLLSSGNMYDPIRDSIEQPNLGDGFSKFSLISNTSVTNTQPSLDSDPVLKSTLGSEVGLDKQSIFNHKKFNGDTSDKNFQGQNLFTNGGEKAKTSYAEQKSVSTLSKEDKLSSHFKDITKESKLFSDDDPRNQEDGPRQKKELNVDRSNNDMTIDLKMDEEQKESKALRYFRAALVDFVKELVKPKWREGHLSKDAHKIIVKRAVEKVLNTLQPQQTPSTEESIKQYLSASEQKISKLVEGYVVKYGKS